MADNYYGPPLPPNPGYKGQEPVKVMPPNREQQFAAPVSEGIPAANRGEKAQAAVSGCARQLCIPRPTIGNLSVTAGGASYTPAEPMCICWSDLIVYGASVGAILVGAWSMFLVRR